jgi:hypothetical protein
VTVSTPPVNVKRILDHGNAKDREAWRIWHPERGHIVLTHEELLLVLRMVLAFADPANECGSPEDREACE